jgi:hypothetical protein
MTRHLRDTEFVDFTEGTLAAPRAAHLEMCAECRAHAKQVAAALRDVSAIEMPEPSPLFWDHFSARVREQVAQERHERAAWWATVGVRALIPLVAALAVIIVVSVTLLPRVTHAPGTTDALVASHTVGASVTPDMDVPADVDTQDAEVWQVLAAAASDMGVDDAHAAGMGVRPGAVDHAVTHMNQAELNELGRLLQTELKGSGH